MGEDVYEGDPSAPQNSTEFINYQTGFKMGCYGLVEYSIFMSLGSAIIEKFDLFEKIPIKNIYALSYGIGKSEKIIPKVERASKRYEISCVNYSFRKQFYIFF